MSVDSSGCLNEVHQGTHNRQVFGGQLDDYWWRIEFQNGGNPHLHMVLWTKGHSLFDAPEGIEQMDSVCTCDPPLENTELHNLVRKIQQHRHTHTCKKNDARSAIYRLNFPRQVCSETRIAAHSSDDFIRSGRRICLLKRRKEDIWGLTTTIQHYKSYGELIWIFNHVDQMRA
ncbi:hypothetical protein AVEN_5340-1 [Araneus ventricosus]|uniref:Helitron helicase-like domain-containing protein n=1 Tax=Araneus ventricosus TaxID=182803 RepID=A0A4Y2MD03_ARAVE|nr:hypothetical protein AVEN_5340-1 [Araneus ventricosus]